MKKIFVVGLVMASAIVYAAGATAQTNGCAGNGQPKDIAGVDDGSAFVRVGFQAKCSANVLSHYAQTATAFGVVAGSQKGKNYFGGGTTGGTVKGMGSCPSTGCTTTEVSATNAATARDAGS